MSLFLGNLPQHMHREDIEQEFRRFGRNSVRIKDGYGFVIFEVPEDADRALRAMRGKTICGERIALSWSNKQPRNSQNFVRGGRFREPPRGRYDRDFDRSAPRGMRGRGFMRPPLDRRRGSFFTRERERDRENRPRDRIDDYEEISGRNSDDELLDAGRRDGDARGGDVSPAENGRWGQQANSVDGHDQDGSDFERYEPDHDDLENQRNSGSYSSPAPGSPREKKEHSSDARMKDLDNLKKQPLCFNCGLFGHLMRNCPRGNSSRPERFGQLRRRRDDDDDDADYLVRGEEEFRRMRTTSRGRAGGRIARLLGRYPRDGKGSHPLTAKRSSRSREKFNGDEKDHDDRLALQSKQRKRSKHRRKSPDRLRRKRIKRSNSRSSSSSSSSSHSDSDRVSSRSHSLSSRSASGSHSSSLSKSYSKSRSGAHRTRSASVSSHSRSKGIRSKTRSRTRSRSRSRSSADRPASLSLDRKSTASPDNRLSVFSSHLSGKQERASDANHGDIFIQIPENIELKVDNEIMGSPIHTDHDDADEILVGNNVDHSHVSSGDTRNEELHSSIPKIEKNPFASEKLLVDIEGNLDSGDSFRVKPAAASAAGSQIQDALRISSQELCTALKHYGLEAPEESVPGTTAEMYFGAARFWPWEMIYYRRLKKGPISTENYACRIMQNKEFGIVDRYIRSSSGWSETNGSDT